MNTKTGKKRTIHEITNLRALAILFVVVGHSIIIYSSTWGRYTSEIKVPALDYLKAYINIIQMPLYFSISGFLYNLSAKRPFAVFVKNKAKRLLVPWVFFAVAMMYPVRMLVHYHGYQGLSFPYIFFQLTLLGKDDGHVWFLSCLFLCFIMSYLYDQLIERIHMDAVVSKIVILFIAFAFMRKEYLLGDIGLFRNPGKYLFYFQIGCIISMFWDRRKKDIRVQIIGAMIYIVSSVLGMTLLKYKYTIPYVMIRILLVVSLYMIVPGKTCKATEFLSNYSFGLYLFHSPLVYITCAYMPNVHPVIFVGMNLIVFGLLSILLTWVFKHSALRVLIGE